VHLLVIVQNKSVTSVFTSMVIIF